MHERINISTYLGKFIEIQIFFLKNTTVFFLTEIFGGKKLQISCFTCEYYIGKRKNSFHKFIGGNSIKQKHFFEQILRYC